MTHTLGALEDTFRGDVIRPGHPDYDEFRRVFNGMIDRRPLVIARCTGVDDVATAIAFGRENDLPIAVRAGGHGVTGDAVCDDGLCIDLRPMKDIHVDAERRVARVGAGVTWGELDQVT